MLGGGLSLVEAGQAAIVPLIEAPVLFDGQPEAAHFSSAIERLDRPGLERVKVLSKSSPCRASARRSARGGALHHVDITSR